ncbi:aldehyde dehydrogenase [Daldinia caldariorum]|uniref:aldehyde dehydrogenase n=1 Tax=Daldinia caldariorum TaxID=326644 RepID=UPI0020078DBF|nr:aldehyde dehydrogenase [Daldinia caldariorum]KAI1464446.1 aldehyde dehydrogenase [Daldinia caldariorum]
MPSFQPISFDNFFNVIDGKLTSTETTRRSVNPSTLKNNPDVPLSTIEDVDKAVQAAKKAAESWAQVSWEDRKKAVEGFASALEAQIDDFAALITREQGKPFPRAQLEMRTGVEWIREFCQLSLLETVIEDNSTRRISTRYTPLGVVAAIIPWNYPVHPLACGKIAPALLTGNVMILKPSPFTPYSNLKLAELGLQFFPPGVLQALSGDDRLGPWMTEHPDIDKIAFTGSIETGKKVMESCSKTLKRVTLELGGNDPAIVCADVDPAAIPTITGIAFDNAGQICCGIKRLYVHESVYDTVVATLLAVLPHLKLGDGFADGAFIPPLTNVQQFERVRELLSEVERTGLKLIAGSTKPTPGAGKYTGYFVAPTVIDNPPEDSKIVAEEQFGPVIPIIKWTDEEDVIKRANNTRYGLGASVWTQDIAQAERMASKLQAGTVWINSHAELGASYPFGGHKNSGLGVEWGIEGMKSYCNIQTKLVRSSPWDGKS